jgi:hypothetical protein
MYAVKEQNPNQRKVLFCNTTNQNLRTLGMYQLYNSKSVESIYGEESTCEIPFNVSKVTIYTRNKTAYAWRESLSGLNFQIMDW